MQASSAATQQPCPSPLSASLRKHTIEDLETHFGTKFKPDDKLIKAIEAGY
jgi:hypothetical protein